MDNQRNTILAIVLSLLILLGWNTFVLGPQLEAERQAAQELAEQEAARNPVAEGTIADPGAGDLPSGTATATLPGSTVDAPGAVAGREAALALDGRVPIRTDALTGSINLKGARLDDLILNRYRQTADESSPPVELLNPAALPNGYFVELGFVGDSASGPVPGPDTVWTAQADAQLTESTPLVLTWDNGQGLTFTREITVDANYLFTVTDRISNASDAAVALKPYGRTTRFAKPAGTQVFVLHEGLIGYFADEGLEEIGYGEVEDAAEDGNGVLDLGYQRVSDGWLGISDKYWATALIPEAASSGGFVPRFANFTNGRTRYQADYLEEPIAVPAGGETTTVNRVYAGAKVSSIIDEVGEAFAIPNFDLMIDWGWFYFITRPMFWLIDGLFNLVGNFGVAILLATVVVKILFFPLANKSYASMAKMKKLQPRMMEIREKHADDRQAQQRAMMEIYQTEKINPVAGCWPVLLQIPVFFALYKVLYVTIEMRHAPFFGWIQDLSAPDPSSIWELFGLFPWGAEAVLPAFLLLGVWPIIMGVTMFLQMRMNPVPPDPTQQMIFTWMPVIFTFMLSTFPAGLVIYWAWNNTLSILQQGVIMKRHGAKIELWDNLKALFTRKKAPDPAE